jgi:uncharacterized protein (DUF58 family)
MPPSRLRYLTIITRLLLSTITILGAVNSTVGSYRVHMAPDKDTYHVGEPINIKVVVENRLNTPYKLGAPSPYMVGYVKNGEDIMTGSIYLNWG